MHSAIDSAEKGEISRERCDIGKRSITHAHCKNVIPANASRGGHFEPEHPEAASMLAQGNAVHPDVRYRVDAIEVDEQLATRFTCIDREMTTVEAGPAIIVIATILAILGVPGVGDRNDGPAVVVEAFLFCASHIAFNETPTIDQQRIVSNLRRWCKRLRQIHRSSIIRHVEYLSRNVACRRPAAKMCLWKEIDKGHPQPCRRHDEPAPSHPRICWLRLSRDNCHNEFMTVSSNQ